MRRLYALVPAGARYWLLRVSLKYIPQLRYVWLRGALLRSSGWVASAHANVPVDRNGRPLPWYTYAATAFLEPRVRREMTVFEYGAGNSTLWWAERVSLVHSVESDRHWVDALADRLLPNTDLRYEPLTDDGPYARSALSRDQRFDLIVIDGFDRNNCARRCLPALADGGVIVWDNSDSVHLFEEGLSYLEASGFRRLDFTGLGALNGYGWMTSIFYRPGNNCLGI